MNKSELWDMKNCLLKFTFTIFWTFWDTLGLITSPCTFVTTITIYNTFRHIIWIFDDF